jgi:hypothetical protein
VDRWKVRLLCRLFWIVTRNISLEKRCPAGRASCAEGGHFMAF